MKCFLKRCGVLLLPICLLCACTAAPSSAPAASTAASSTSVDGGTTTMVNPLVPAKDANALYAALQITIACPVDAINVHYYVLGGDIAQISFELDGTSYILRGSKRTDDFAGIYETAIETITQTITVGSDSTQVALTDYPSGSLSAWTWGDAQYTLYAKGASIDASNNVRTICATVSANTATAQSADEYLLQLYQSTPERTVTEIRVISPAAYDSITPNDVSLKDTLQSVSGNVSWQDFLTKYPTAQLCSVSFTVTSTTSDAQYAPGDYTQYMILAQAENGNYYVAVASML